jgi:hypothetical protein
MKYRSHVFVSVLLSLLLLSSHVFSQEDEDSSPTPPSKLTLVQAVMCEGIKGYNPENEAVVFSIKIGKVSCYTSFDPVPEKTFIYQKWFHRDRLSTKIKLFLQPPRWSTFSSIQLREADKGPWRVEIADQRGNLLDTVRFSITD